MENLIFAKFNIFSNVYIFVKAVFTRCDKVVPGLGTTNLLLLLLLLLAVSEF
jgi:hypothetical protein